jgi:hypothetical protein
MLAHSACPRHLPERGTSGVLVVDPLVTPRARNAGPFEDPRPDAPRWANCWRAAVERFGWVAGAAIWRSGVVNNAEEVEKSVCHLVGCLEGWVVADAFESH